MSYFAQNHHSWKQSSCYLVQMNPTRCQQKNIKKKKFNATTFIEQPKFFSKNQSSKEKSNQKAIKTKEIGKNKPKKKKTQKKW
jgi:hypothetical protein